MRKNDAFDAKIENTRLTKIFIAIFAPDERLPSSATLHEGITATKRAYLYIFFFNFGNKYAVGWGRGKGKILVATYKGP